MRGPTLALFLAVTPLRAQLPAGTGTDLSAAERVALEQLGEAVPGVPGYTDMWRVQLVQASEPFEPGSYRDYRRALADARAGRLQLTDPEVVVNGPVMYVDRPPAAR